MTYNRKQIIMSLNLLSNISGLYTGTREEIEKSTAKIMDKILKNEKVKNLLGAVQIVWGPGVFQHEIKHSRPPYNPPPDNTLYVAKIYTGEYIVSVAGTVDSSAYDWFVEDLDWKLEYWEDNNKQKGKITRGIKTGLQNLMSIKPSVGFSPNKTIVQFFNEKNDNSLHITTTGHSLGGSLAPAAALHLKEKIKNNPTLSTYSTAGTQFCDAELVNYMKNELGGDNKILRSWNDKDLVPYLWRDISEYWPKYTKKYPKLADWMKIAEIAWVLLSNLLPDHSDIDQLRHIGGEGEKIEGDLYNDNELEIQEGYFVELAHQHVQEYINKWEIKEIIKIVEDIIKDAENKSLLEVFKTMHPLVNTLKQSHKIGRWVTEFKKEATKLMSR